MKAEKEMEKRKDEIRRMEEGDLRKKEEQEASQKWKKEELLRQQEEEQQRMERGKVKGMAENGER